MFVYLFLEIEGLLLFESVLDKQNVIKQTSYYNGSAGCSRLRPRTTRFYSSLNVLYKAQNNFDNIEVMPKAPRSTGTSV